MPSLNVPWSQFVKEHQIMYTHSERMWVSLDVCWTLEQFLDYSHIQKRNWFFVCFPLTIASVLFGIRIWVHINDNSSYISQRDRMKTVKCRSKSSEKMWASLAKQLLINGRRCKRSGYVLPFLFFSSHLFLSIALLPFSWHISIAIFQPKKPALQS